MVTWKPTVECDDEPRTHFTAIDNDASVVVESLSRLKASKFDSPEDTAEKQARLDSYARDKYSTTSHCKDDLNTMERGDQTLFVNAAIAGHNGETQRPWVVELELAKYLRCRGCCQTYGSGRERREIGGL